MEKNLKFNSAICTSRVQSERLLALGLKKETADMLLSEFDDGSWRPVTFFIEEPDDSDASLYPDETIDIPAWSLNRLIEMMPLDVVPEGGLDNCFTLIKNYPKGYSVEYDGFSYYHKEDIYDTIIDGIEHLIKEGYFNKEYLEE